MTKAKITNLQLLQELDQRLNRTKEIGFWIEGQDCYLWENTYHYSNKIKVGDLSLTRERYFLKLTEEFNQQHYAHEKRNQFLITKFSEISDVELIDELAKRAKWSQPPTIKLSMYPQQKHIFIEGQEVKCGGGACLPIEIKENNLDSKTKSKEPIN